IPVPALYTICLLYSYPIAFFHLYLLFFIEMYPPVFSTKPDHMTLYVGKQATFQCVVTGSSPMTIVWHKDNITKYSLQIKNLQLNDQGTYLCKASNSVELLLNDSQCFVDPPSFLKVPQPIEGMKGKDASLHCEIIGTAPFEITWSKDKTPLKESRKYKMVNEGTSATLHIIGLEASDVGEYECKASNSVGYETCRTTIQLRDKTIPPTFTRKLKDYQPIVGKAGEIDCKVSGSAPFTITWYHDGEEIQTGPNYEITFSDNTCMLKVPTLKLSDSGVYKCKAVNKAGTNETSASFIVKGQ
uniref:Ig-like domain-containing protein n=1 Tax=Oncorhynchus mykiss TaxID=8022 RepID=A0A8K9VBA5_ONCMY